MTRLYYPLGPNSANTPELGYNDTTPPTTTDDQILWCAWTDEQLSREVRDNGPHAKGAAEEAYRRWKARQ